MKKRFSKLTALVLFMVLTLSVIPAQAAQAKPTPPDWWPEEDYLIFEGDPLYSSDAWNDILTVRQEVLNGVNIFDRQKSPTYENLRNLELHKEYKTPALYYELALINMGVFCTGAKSGTTNASYYFFHAADILSEDHPYRRILTIWDLRCGILDRKLQDNSTYGLAYRDYRLARMDEKMTKYSITFVELRDHPLMDSVSQADWSDNTAKLDKYRAELPAKQAAEAAKRAEREAQRKAEAEAEAEADRLRLKIILDGVRLQCTDTQPTSKSGRIMVPIRVLAEALGADVGWDSATAQVTLTRANTNIVLTLGSKTAYVNGQAMEMDVAPYTSGSRTMIPVRYISEFFGQTVTWDGKTRRVYVAEDKSVAEGSNLEAWALPMGSMLASFEGDPSHFGILSRGLDQVKIIKKNPAQFCREQLSGWSIENREDLIGTVFSMTFHGHNASFHEMAADVKLRSQAEREAISAASSAWPSYMWEYTEYVDEKWGDRGILCWDLFRMSNLVQWGYNAGYITYAEALALLEPAATLLCANFSSWEEAYENYLDGYNWWARNNVLGQDIWQTERGVKYSQIKERYGQIFDNSLFKTGVLPVPGLSVNDVIATLSDEA